MLLILKHVRWDLDPDALFWTSPTPDLLGFEPITQSHLDFTIVAIKPHPKITAICYVAFSIFHTPIPQENGHANIIHYPLGGIQKVSFRENRIKEIAYTTIHYTTATEAGSSGAPVMDDEGNLIALHRAISTHILKGLLKMLTPLL